MNNEQIKKIVARELKGASELYLQDIISHGIHNLTNDFHGETDEQYILFADEFNAQAKKILEALK